MKTQHLESLVVEVDVRYKPLLKTSELLLLLLLRHDDKPTEYRGVYGGVADDSVMWEVGRAAPPYVLEVR
jgi:hypothetical protein